jgi:hypothetical protein
MRLGGRGERQVYLNSKRPKAKRATAYKKTFSLGIEGEI